MPNITDRQIQIAAVIFLAVITALVVLGAFGIIPAAPWSPIGKADH